MGEALGIIGVVLALSVPLGIEWARRPQLVIEKGSDANSEDPLWRIVHVRVVNKPLGTWFGKLLLRNEATGCQVRMEFRSKSDGTPLSARGKWSAKPQPLSLLSVENGMYRQTFNPESIPQTLTLDLSPSPGGEPVAVAIKHNGDEVAYAFDPDIYAGGNLRRDALALKHEEYEVTVTASAGEIVSKPQAFILKNRGSSYRDLELQQAE